MKKIIHIVFILVFAALLTGCGQSSPTPDINVIVAVTLTQTAIAPQQTAVPPRAAPPAASAVISGKVHLMAPPTPHMTVYALDPKTGLWASTETAATNEEAPFTLKVPPGSYQVVAFMDNNGFVGYSADGGGLTLVPVAANQTVTGINVGPPSQNECGSMYGVPASPDNRFKAVPGPSSDCLATAQASGNGILPTQAPTGDGPIATPVPQRIQFAPGAISAQVKGKLNGNDAVYVLSAMAGQEMTVTLYPGGDSAVSKVNVTVFGKTGGTLFSSGPVGLTSWSGKLPAAQDYIIDLTPASQAPFDYTLEVIVSAIKAGTQPSEVLPNITPVGFESLYGLGRNIIMLPPEFPVAAGLPAVRPYALLSNGENAYDFSLDYGTDCSGAGACHYGSMSGKKVASNQPESTANFKFDAARAVKVALAKNLQGYFVEGLCGASCDDSKVFWVYNGQQYMFGLKGASQKAVVDLANAAINNSLH